MMVWLQTFTFVGVIMMMVVGLLGLAIPIYPGLFVIWLGTLIYGLINGFSNLGIILFIIITILTIFGSIVDNLLMGVGARQSGVPWMTIGAAMVVGIIATLFHPLLGLCAAPLGLFLLEWRRLKTTRAALNSLKGLLRGWGLGVLARFGVGLVMILIWGVWVWQA